MRAAASFVPPQNIYTTYLCVSGKSEAMSGHCILSLALHLFESSERRYPEPGVVFRTSLQ
jgi:hypothetical protein